MPARMKYSKGESAKKENGMQEGWSTTKNRSCTNTMTTRTTQKWHEAEIVSGSGVRWRSSAKLVMNLKPIIIVSVRLWKCEKENLVEKVHITTSPLLRFVLSGVISLLSRPHHHFSALYYQAL
ncbi:hypothetical protein QVD17_10854 [Tagetes erecta]|uniref:Uncharacterized protein n=1 Tax=Tagetes erecta TaxID=13708 RepID=A0AAD8P6P9_TARER|nr:hypothetical protein QVD17_10854 [Tagetes erecta]